MKMIPAKHCAIVAVIFVILHVGWANTVTDEVKEYLKRRGEGTDNFFKHVSKTDEQNKTDGENIVEYRDRSRQKREATVKSLNRDGSPIGIDLVTFDPIEGSRVKRATYNTTSATWPHEIPYQFDPNYPEDLKPKLRKALQELMDNICVKFVEEPNFDPENNNYETNAYISFSYVANVCSAFLGRGSGTGQRVVKTCKSFNVMIHEVLHCLGAIHEQQGFRSDQHMTRKQANVMNGYYPGTYKPHYSTNNIVSNELDASGVMMYSPRAFSNNGLDVLLAFYEDEFKLGDGRKDSLKSIFEEMNQVYKCRETYCSGQTVDCGLGYFTRVKGQCQCVCPEGFKSSSNCQELEGDDTGPSEWPDVPFSVYAADENVCPEGFTKARFDITNTRAPIVMGEPFFSSGAVTNFHMCTRDATAQQKDLDQLPEGDYCVIKPKDQPCDGVYTEGGYVINSVANFTFEGDFGDWEISPENPLQVTMKYCCRQDQYWNVEMEVPTQTPFRLVINSHSCQEVKGMRFTKGMVVMFITTPKKYGKAPLSWATKTYIIHNFCTYAPPKALPQPCRQIVTLDAGHKQETLTTPGFESGQRESNVRCYYYFKVPKDSRIKLTFDTFDIDATDFFKIRRFNKWAKSFNGFQNNYRKQIISAKDFLFLEYWAGPSPMSGKKGIQFTAEVLLKEDLCYDSQDRGESYQGRKWVSESFEECLPWKEATHCDDFPFSSSESLSLLAHNYCRNPVGEMERPWCYVSVDRGMCRRQYCDICNNLDKDQVKECNAMSGPDMCSSSLQRTKCGQTCNLDFNVPPPAYEDTCGYPEIPSDGTPTSALRSEYNVGEVASFYCNVRGSDGPKMDKVCTRHGWSPLHTACAECPPGWIPYQTRCILYNPRPRLVADAHEFCQGQGSRLFHAENSDDISVLREIKILSSIPEAKESSWLNFKLSGAGQWSVFDDQSVDAIDMSWASGSVMDDPANYGCAVLESELASGGNAGKAMAVSCGQEKSATFCQIDRLPGEEVPCEDRSAFCLLALSNDPEFCNSESSVALAMQYCPLSCGECTLGADASTCSAPQSSTYSLVSSSSQVTSGQVMEFACSEDLYLKAGDLKRACGHDGQLLGTEPLCVDTPDPQDVGISGVMDRVNPSETKKAFLFDVEGFRIPVGGSITHWHFYANKPGKITFLVYRKAEDSELMHLVGMNAIDVTTINERWTSYVPADQQIVARQGDVYGFYTVNGLIAVTPCGSVPEKLMMLRTEKVKTVDLLVSKDRGFATQQCVIPSVGLRVDPSPVISK